MPWVCLIPFLLSALNILGANRYHFLFVPPQPPGMRGLSIPGPRRAERGPATSLPAGGSGLCWELGALWLLGSSRSWGAWGAWGSPGSPSDPGGMLPRGFLRFPHSDCFLSRPPSRKGQEVIEGRKLVGLSQGELAWCTGGSATIWLPRLCQGTLQRGRGQAGGANLGGREQGGHPSLQEPGNPSPQPESCLEEEHNVNKPPLAALLPCRVLLGPCHPPG